MLSTASQFFFTVCWRRTGTRKSSAGAVIPPSHGPRPKRRLAVCAGMPTDEASVPSQVPMEPLSQSPLQPSTATQQASHDANGGESSGVSENGFIDSGSDIEMGL